MTYRKLKADYLFDGYRILPADSILICDPNGTIIDVSYEKEAGNDVENFSGMIVPGFVNCHCHLELSHLKGLIPEGQGLVSFVLSVMAMRSQLFPLKKEAIFHAETEMLNAGIVAVGDICNSADTIVTKITKRLEYYQFIELLGWAPGLAESRFEAASRLANEFIDSGLDENHISMVPHAPYSVSHELWDLMKAGFRNKTVSIHNQESSAENEFFVSGNGDLKRLYEQINMDNSHFDAPGIRSLPSYLSNLKEAHRILLVHNTYMNEADVIHTLPFGNRLLLCLCPNANLYIEDRLPDIPLFLKHTKRIVLGTDSLASNRQLSILEEIKSIKKVFPDIPSVEMLVWATSNGAGALSFESTLGNFSKGKRPGIVLIENLKAGEINEASTSRRLL